MVLMHGKLNALIASLVIGLAVSTGARGDDMFMTLGAAQSAQLSGLFDHILPIFKTASNLSVHVFALDSGDAAAIEKPSGADALLLDQADPAAKIVADGYGLNPRDAVYNDFVIVGPSSDPAGIRGLKDAVKAFAQIATKSAQFASTGTGDAYRQELRLWKFANIQIDKQAWYRKLTPGDQSALQTAAAVNAYALVGRAAWSSFKDRRSLQILTEGDAALIKVYDSVLVSPEKEPRTKFVYAQIWHGWLTNKHGAAAISSYKINGEQIFFSCQGSALTFCRAAPQR